MLLEAVDWVCEDVPDVRLLLIGDVPDESLRERIDELDLEDTVEWLDYVDNAKLPAYYRGSNVFAIPSRQEGLAIVGLEAMAWYACVVDAVWGPEEYVVDGETGYPTLLDDVEAFAASLKDTLGHSERRINRENGETELISEKHRLIHIFRTFEQEFDDLKTGRTAGPG